MTPSSIPKGSIRILKTPTGPAPLGLRQIIVGHIFPCEFIGCLEGEAELKCFVSQDRGMEIFTGISMDLYIYWRAQGLPQEDGYFCFLVEEVEQIGNIHHVQTKLYDAEMAGQPSR